MRRKILLIINPMAGRQKIKTELLYVIDSLTKAGYETVIYTTQSKVETQRLLKENDSAFDQVMCSGGDGTFNEILSATIKWEKKPVLGYLPAGTTNDFAAGIHLQTDIKKAIHSFINGKIHVYDAGCFNGTYFSYIASFGAFTETSYSTPQNFKNTLGHMAYILEGIKEIPAISSYHTRIVADGQEYEDDFIFGAISNAKSVGGIVKMDQDLVDLNDGLFEVMMVRQPRTILDLSTMVTSINTKQYDSSMFVFFQTKELEVYMDDTIAWSLDGEKVMGAPKVTVTCLKDAFSIMS